jgi:hypothetical protein
MKKFIKAVIVGYAVLWLLNYVKDLIGGDEIKDLNDIKRIIKEKL